jgi:hypothetical protein
MTLEEPIIKLKEKPILFSTPMVRAILEGRKTQTRRVIKPQPESITPITSEGFMTAPHLAEKFIFHFENGESKEIELQPKKGDVLWVRETFNYLKLPIMDKTKYWYKADENMERPNFDNKWRPSIFMPREACRLFLRVKDVRLEHLQDITTSDCLKEGILENFHKTPAAANIRLKADFAKLWNSLNAQRGYSWESNPMVKVIEFERIQNYGGKNG